MKLSFGKRVLGMFVTFTILSQFKYGQFKLMRTVKRQWSSMIEPVISEQGY